VENCGLIKIMFPLSQQLV